MPPKYCKSIPKWPFKFNPLLNAIQTDSCLCFVSLCVLGENVCECDLCVILFFSFSFWLIENFSIESRMGEAL